MKIIVHDHDGVRHELDALEGWQVMEIIRDHGLAIKAECGGCCCCATCEVYVHEDWMAKLYPASLDERDLIEDGVDPRANSRLSCQIVMSAELDGLEVTLAPSCKP